MQLGNLTGNYEVREILNSAIFGYMEIFTLIPEPYFLNLVTENWTSIIPLILLSFILPPVYRHSKGKNQSITFIQTQLNKFKDRIASSYILSPTVAAIMGILFNTLLNMSTYIIVFILVLGLAPAISGYRLGEIKIESIKSKSPCLSDSKSSSSVNDSKSCAYINIHGTEVYGRFLLESSDAYFLHSNSSFIYISKDGKVCALSKYKVPKHYIENFELQPSNSRNLCESIHKNASSR